MLVAGATGHIGRHVTRELVARGHEVVCLARAGGASTENRPRELLTGAELRLCEVTDPGSLREEGLRGERFDAVVSCLATRTGGIEDAWQVEYRANRNLLEALADAAPHFVLLSAICVQRPRLAFQKAKLAFERELMTSGLRWSIVRPTAFFKSLSGQVEAVRRGRRFVVFGDGERTACRPIGDADLARFLADCLVDPAKHDAILPIGGPGEAVTPRQQAEILCELTGRPLRLLRVPVAVVDLVVALLSAGARIVPGLRDKAEFARIARYYATESMLLFDEKTGRYDASATPATGEETLRDFYARALREGLAGQELGDHALFDRKR